MKYLIVGGTGSLGKELIKQIGDPAQIAVMSREELKQKQLRNLYPDVKCYLGDVKSKYDWERVISQVKPQHIFHLAALKHVDIAEENPEECIAVNLMGTVHGAEIAKNYGVKHFIFSSTDKAVLPINTYGMSKALAEQYLFELNKRRSDTRFSVYRWGNVMGSRGSVIHSFKHTLQNEGRVYITDEKMSRFWIGLSTVAKYMLFSFEDAPGDRAMIPPMKAATLLRLADLTAEYLNIKEYKIEITGIRRGEKFHECLWSEHDKCIRSDTCEQYSDKELKKLIKKTLRG